MLVCPITSPIWSMLFPQVGALVCDAGGPMSHPAIIAREFGIPAVRRHRAGDHHVPRRRAGARRRRQRRRGAGRAASDASRHPGRGAGRAGRRRRHHRHARARRGARAGGGVRAVPQRRPRPRRPPAGAAADRARPRVRGRGRGGRRPTCPSVRPGDHVVTCTSQFCGTCRTCAAGETWLCERRRPIGRTPEQPAAALGRPAAQRPGLARRAGRADARAPQRAGRRPEGGARSIGPRCSAARCSPAWARCSTGRGSGRARRWP